MCRDNVVMHYLAQYMLKPKYGSRMNEQTQFSFRQKGYSVVFKYLIRTANLKIVRDKFSQSCFQFDLGGM